METIVNLIKFYDTEENELECKAGIDCLYVKENGTFRMVEGLSYNTHNVQLKNLSIFGLDTIDVLLQAMCDTYSMDIDLFSGDILIKEYRNKIRVIK